MSSWDSGAWQDAPAYRLVSVKWPRSRIVRECSDCGRQIERGERYCRRLYVDHNEPVTSDSRLLVVIGHSESGSCYQWETEAG